MEKVNLLVGPDMQIIRRSFNVFKQKDVLELNPKRLNKFLFDDHPQEQDIFQVIPYVYRGLSMGNIKTISKLEKLTLFNVQRISTLVPNYFIQFFIFDEDFIYNEFLNNKKTSLVELIKINRINKITVDAIKNSLTKDFTNTDKMIGVTNVSFWDREAKEETSMYSRIA